MKRQKERGVGIVNWTSRHRDADKSKQSFGLHTHEYSAWFYAERVGVFKPHENPRFDLIEKMIGAWIKANWDHSTLVWADDYELMSVRRFIGRPKPAYVMKFDPTTENIAQYLLKNICPLLMSGTGIVVKTIKLFESDCTAVEVSV